MKTLRGGSALALAVVAIGCGDDNGSTSTGTSDGGGGTTAAVTTSADASTADSASSASSQASSVVATVTTGGDGGGGSSGDGGGTTAGTGGQGGETTTGTGGAGGTGGEGGSVSCGGDFVLCSDGCTDTQTDRDHCGGCDDACGASEACVGGECSLECAGGATLCEGECVDTDLDPRFCGGCDGACDAGELCSAGQCGSSCLGGTTQCGEFCVDTDLDPANCGDCEQPCQPGEVCSGGECGISCTGGTTLCEEACVDTDVDPTHCGDCVTVCDPGELCSLGECGVECAGQTEPCDGVCVDTSSSPEHCGDCDAPCGQGQACVGGDCTGTVCVANASELCYVGPPGTLGEGECVAGTKTCNAQGTGYGACVGQVVPAPESCTNGIDDDCDGEVNEGCIYERCSDLETGSPSGIYRLDTNGGSTADAFDTYCDMTTDGGGWALVYNSVGDAAGATTAFWQFPFVDRFDTQGTPALDENFYAGRLYFLDSVTYRDEFEDLFGNIAEAFEATATSLDPNTMRFVNPVRLSGNDSVYTCQFAAGWSSSDFDGDTWTNQCSTFYGNVAQHYCNCWNYNLGADADNSILDGGWGPHVATGTLSALGLAGDGSTYSRVTRITRWVR